jgi:alpha-galactosidase
LRIEGDAHEQYNISIKKVLTIELYDKYPNVAIAKVEYVNTGNVDLNITALWDQFFRLDRSLVNASVNSNDLKAVGLGGLHTNELNYQIRDLSKEFNSYGTDYDDLNDFYTGGLSGDIAKGWENWGGGGTPLLSVWGAEMAMTIGQLETSVKPAYLPLKTDDDKKVVMAIKQVDDIPQFTAGATLSSYKTMISVHSLDFYDGFRNYSLIMQDLGLTMPAFTQNDYNEYWCSFGASDRKGISDADIPYIKSRIDQVMELGISTINIDSKCFTPGDYLIKDDLLALVKELKSDGFNVSGWVDFGWADKKSSIYKSYKSSFILDKTGKVYTDNWGRVAMCPTQSDVIDAMKKTVALVVETYGFDRLFHDGTLLCPPCYNPAHNHESPHESEEFWWQNTIGQVFKTAKAIKPDLTLELCACGTAQSFHHLPYTTQTTVSDPDVFSKRCHEVNGKILKAIFGPQSPVNGDHIEGCGDNLHPPMEYMFSLVLGNGQVYQTYFWEDLSASDMALYKKWFGLYREHMIAKEEYLNLYNFGYENASVYPVVIKKNKDLYYAFYREYDAINWSGTMPLRGLEEGVKYTLIDYTNDNAILGTVSGPLAEWDMTIEKNRPVLFKAVPDTKP